MEVKKAGRKAAGLEEVTERRSLLAKEEQVQAIGRRSALRESLLSIWRVDINQALRMCDGRQVEVDASKASYTSWDRVDDPWPC